MKRSEMLIKLTRYLEPYTPIKANTFGMAEEILDLIEQAGMLPPHDGNAGRIIFEDVQYMIDHYNWEPEDE